MFDKNATETIYVDEYTCPGFKRRNGDGRMAQPDTTRTVGLALEGGGYRGMYTAGVPFAITRLIVPISAMRV